MIKANRRILIFGERRTERRVVGPRHLGAALQFRGTEEPIREPEVIRATWSQDVSWSKPVRFINPV